MKVIFRITKDMPVKDRIYYARNIRNAWNETRDMDCMICFADDVEVYVVDSDAEPEIVDDEKLNEGLNELARLFRKANKPKNGLGLWLDSNAGWYEDSEGNWVKNGEQENKI